MVIVRDWNEFWFSEKSPATLGLYRILFGIICLFWGVLAAPPNLYTWYSEQGMVPLQFYHQYTGSSFQISLLDNVKDPNILFGFWCLYLFTAFSFTIGFFTRFSTILLFALFSSFNVRDPMVLNSGDTMMRCILFLMLFAPSDLSCSVDRLLAIGRGDDPGGDPAPVELWSQRLMQVQISLLYIATVVSKLSGNDWLNGTAVYYPLHMAEMHRFPLNSIFTQPWMINILTWGTLAAEVGLGILIWFRRTRGYVIPLGVMLHSGIEYALNIPLFSFIMVSGYVNFFYNEWLIVFVSVLTKSFSRYSLIVQLPEGVSKKCIWWKVVERLDIVRLLTVTENESPDHTSLRVLGKGWESTGVKALRRLLIASPVFWLPAPLLFIPGTDRFLERYLPKPDLMSSSIPLPEMLN